MTASHSPKLLAATVGVVCTFFVGLVSLVVGLLTIGGLLLGIGVWKGNVDYRISTAETSAKEQIVALAASTDKQVLTVQAAAREMVTALAASTDKRLTDIETDRRAKLDEFARYRAEKDTKDAKMDTLLTNQQKQIDYLVEISGRRPGR